MSGCLQKRIDYSNPGRFRRGVSLFSHTFLHMQTEAYSPGLGVQNGILAICATSSFPFSLPVKNVIIAKRCVKWWGGHRLSNRRVHTRKKKGKRKEILRKKEYDVVPSENRYMLIVGGACLSSELRTDPDGFSLPRCRFRNFNIVTSLLIYRRDI